MDNSGPPLPRLRPSIGVLTFVVICPGCSNGVPGPATGRETWTQLDMKRTDEGRLPVRCRSCERPFRLPGWLTRHFHYDDDTPEGYDCDCEGGGARVTVDRCTKCGGLLGPSDAERRQARFMERTVAEIVGDFEAHLVGCEKCQRGPASMCDIGKVYARQAGEKRDV